MFYFTKKKTNEENKQIIFVCLFVYVLFTYKKSWVMAVTPVRHLKGEL